MPVKGLLERLKAGGSFIVGEGYVLEMERRGYLRAGCFVPEVVLEHPEVVKGLHEEFAHAGSDVVLAFTYYGHRQKLKVIGREDELEELNRRALKMAREVADKTNTLMAGNICNSTVYQAGNEEAIETTRAMFKEQIEWAISEGADYIVGESFEETGEALLALECIKKYGNGVPAVISLIPFVEDKTTDGIPFAEACRIIEEAGADVVGLNCSRGPDTMMPLMREIRKACKGPISMLPIPFRTTPEQPTWHKLKDAEGNFAFPVDLPAFTCGRTKVKEFAEEAKKLGVQYIGLCCGNAGHYLRVVAEVYGRTPPASKYSPDMSEHYLFGDEEHKQEYYIERVVQDDRK